MPHEFAEHTGEVEIVAEAGREEDVLVEVLEAFAELVGPGTDGRPARREIELDAPDRASLLVDWVNELVYLADVDGFVPEAVAELSLEGTRLRATVEGRAGAGPAGLVKAATLNGAELERREDGWRARLVLDV